MNDIRGALEAFMDEQLPGSPAPFSSVLLKRQAARRRWYAATGAALAAVLVVVGAALLVPRSPGDNRAGTGPAAGSASATPTTPTQTPSARPTSTTPTSPAVTTSVAPTTIALDPRVLSDVIAGAFQMPDGTELRTIRVRNYARSIANVACGGKPMPNLDSTYNRYDQFVFADVDLIAAKGLVEPGLEDAVNNGDGAVDLGSCGSRLDAVLPGYLTWDGSFPWSQTGAAATHSAPTVRATVPTVAACLAAGSPDSMTISATDPVGTYPLDGYLMRLKNPADGPKESLRLSKVFASCTRPYFAALAKVLAPLQQEQVRKHSAFLHSFARALAAAGYKP